MPFRIKSGAERLLHTYEGATIFYHPLTYSQQGALLHRCTERGETDWRALRLLAAQHAVDGWDTAVHDADDQPIAVPGGTPEERRQHIAKIVEAFPTELIVQLAELAFADNAEKARKNLLSIFDASSSSPTDAPEVNSPATIVDDNAAMKDLLFPVIKEV